MSKTIELIEWVDSYGSTSTWEGLENYNPILLKIKSAGIVVYEDAFVVAISNSYSEETEYTKEQSNGIMVIPKQCIITRKDLLTI